MSIIFKISLKIQDKLFIFQIVFQKNLFINQILYCKNIIIDVDEFDVENDDINIRDLNFEYYIIWSKNKTN